MATCGAVRPVRRAGANRYTPALLAGVLNSHTFTMGAYRRCYQYGGSNQSSSQPIRLVYLCILHGEDDRLRSRHSERTRRKTFLPCVWISWWGLRELRATNEDALYTAVNDPQTWIPKPLHHLPHPERHIPHFLGQEAKRRKRR